LPLLRIGTKAECTTVKDRRTATERVACSVDPGKERPTETQIANGFVSATRELTFSLSFGRELLNWIYEVLITLKMNILFLLVC
jgi:hypothetical protein